MSSLNFRRLFIFLLISVFSYFSSNGGFSSGTGEDIQNNTFKSKFGGTYKRGLAHDPATLDPGKMTDNYGIVVTQQITEGLVQYSDNLMVVPCIAESWKSSRDNLRWVFYLKKGVKFHNGREVSADDFIYTFTRILNPDTGSRAASLLMKIEGASEFRDGKADRVEGLNALDPKTLEIRLSESFPPFIAVLAMVNFGVIPREEIERLGDDFGTQPVGTGPYRFGNWERNREIVLEANSDYHEGGPYLDKVVFKIFPGHSPEQMFNEFEMGNLEDSLFPVAKRDSVMKDQKYSILRRPSLTIRLFVMNNQTEPFNNKLVRQAFNYAIDKDQISADIGKGRLIPATGFLPPGMAGYKPDDTNYPYSPERARELLNEAGFPGGEGLGVIQFWSSVKSDALLAEDEAIRRYLSEVGIAVEFNYLTDWPEFKKILEEGKAPIFKYSWEADVPDPDNILSSLFHSKSTTNRAFYNNPRTDALIENAQNNTDYSKRISLYSEIQDMIMEDAPVILLNYRAYERIFQKYVRDFEGTALGDHYLSLKSIWLDSGVME
jgi:peptide/nickel transport system substrate-binding protein/oligopeptide transport system substrate-binding protein